jgi:putative ABC transport system permease protein
MNITRLTMLELSERRNQLATSLLAVTLGIAAIVGIQTIAVHSEREVARQVDALGANILVLPKSATVENYYNADLGETGTTIPEEYVDRILMAKKEQGLEGVDNLSPKLNTRIKLNGRDFTLTGIIPKSEFAAKAAWSGGVFDTPTSCAASRKSLVSYTVAEQQRRKPIEKLGPTECLIGAEVAEIFGLKVGDKLPISKDLDFTILQVLDKTGTVDDSRIFTHLKTVQDLSNRGRVINAIEIVGCCNEIAAGLIDKLNLLLPEAKVVTISQIVSTQRTTNQLMHKLTGVFLIVIVLVGGASIANYMYANAYERRREIGTLMALGATPWMVLRLFLLKALVLGLAGGLIGAAAGTVLAVVLGPKIAHIPVMPLPSLFFAAIGLSLLLTLLASLFPSLKAARTDPCQAIQDL